MAAEDVKRWMQNVDRFTGQEWSEVVQRFEAEMAMERVKHGLKPWQFWDEKTYKGNK